MMHPFDSGPGEAEGERRRTWLPTSRGRFVWERKMRAGGQMVTGLPLSPTAPGPGRKKAQGRGEDAGRA